MLVPTNDYPEMVPFHAYIASFSGTEYDFLIVRATGNGLSAAFDDQWRTLATAYYATTKLARILYVPTHGVKTVYTVIGDLFAWLVHLDG